MRGILRLKRDGTCPETIFGLSAKRTSPFKLAGGRGQFSQLLAIEECGSAVVMAVVLDRPCSEAECNSTGYPLHSPVSPSLPHPCVTVFHQVSAELYLCFIRYCNLELYQRKWREPVPSMWINKMVASGSVPGDGNYQSLVEISKGFILVINKTVRIPIWAACRILIWSTKAHKRFCPRVLS